MACFIGNGAWMGSGSGGSAPLFSARSLSAEFARLGLMPSSAIQTFDYDAENRVLAITFISGRRYRYHGVPPDVYAAMVEAFAKGEFFNREIRDRYRFSA